MPRTSNALTSNAQDPNTRNENARDGIETPKKRPKTTAKTP